MVVVCPVSGEAEGEAVIQSLRDLDRWARENGFEHLRNGRHRVYVYPPTGKRAILSLGSRASPYSIRNMLASLKRAMRADVTEPSKPRPRWSSRRP